jgi:predicted RNA-binding Zn-ribbon protein involved in translation (DUF1610 family)
MKKERFVKFCPRCNSTDITILKEIKVLQTGAFPMYYKCRNCGFSLHTFPEIAISKVPELKIKKMKYAPTTPVHVGKFIAYGWWKIVGPIGLLICAFLFFSAFNPVVCTMREIEKPVFPEMPELGTRIIYEEVCLPDTSRVIDVPYLITSSFFLPMFLFATFVGYFPKHFQNIIKRSKLMRLLSLLLILWMFFGVYIVATAMKHIGFL